LADFNSILRTLTSGAGRAVSRAEENLMPAPPSGLLSPEDLAAARRAGMLHLGMSLLGDTSGNGLGPALAQGLGAAQQGYQGTAQNTLAMQAAMKQQQMLQQRTAIGQKYAPKAGETPNYAGMYADYMAAGDLDAAKNVAQLVQEQLHNRGDDKLQAVQAGDRIYTFDPRTGVYTPGPERHMNADELADKRLGRQLQMEQIAAMRTAREAQQGQLAGNAFMSQNKDLLATEQLYGNWKGAYEDAKSANPALRQAAYKSAIVNFSRIADPGTRSTLGMLHYLETVQPSLVSRFKLTAEKLANGDFPPAVLDAMNQHVVQLHRNHLKEYESKRASRVKAHPSWESYIPPTNDVFPLGSKMDEETTTSTPAAGVSRVQQFLNGFKGN